MSHEIIETKMPVNPPALKRSKSVKKESFKAESPIEKEGKITEEDDVIIRQQANLKKMINTGMFANSATEMFYRLPLSDEQRKAVFAEIFPCQQISKSSSKKDSSSATVNTFKEEA